MRSSHAGPGEGMHGLAGLPRVRVAFGARSEVIDAWPRTTRVLPWMIAAFLVMLWLVPFQAVTLPFRLPVDSKLDRVMLASLAFVWFSTLVAGGGAAPRFRSSFPTFLALTLGSVAVAGVLVNADVLANVGDLSLAAKKVPLLFSYILFFVIASTSIRSSEVKSFAALTLFLAATTSVFTIWEYRTRQNLLRDITAQLLPPGFGLQARAVRDSVSDRISVIGPTDHGLALTTILAFALPLAVVALINSESRREKVAYAAATAWILAAQVATVRRTAVVMPAAAFLVLLAYHPRRVLRLAPLGLLIVVFIQAVAPAALSTLRYFLQPSVLSVDDSKLGRTEDYSAVLPDIKAHLLLGRGYGSYDPHKYRILDNQYLGMLVETGVIGLAIYVILIVSVMYLAHQVIRRGTPRQAGSALAIVAGAAAFLACNALFDTLAFSQVPYLFFFMAALAVVLASDLPLRSQPAADERFKPRATHIGSQK